MTDAELRSEIAHLEDLVASREHQQLDNDRLRVELAEVAAAAQAFMEFYGARLAPGPLEQRLRAALRGSSDESELRLQRHAVWQVEAIRHAVFAHEPRLEPQQLRAAIAKILETPS